MDASLSVNTRKILLLAFTLLLCLKVSPSSSQGVPYFEIKEIAYIKPSVEEPPPQGFCGGTEIKVYVSLEASSTAEGLFEFETLVLKDVTWDVNGIKHSGADFQLRVEPGDRIEIRLAGTLVSALHPKPDGRIIVRPLQNQPLIIARRLPERSVVQITGDAESLRLFIINITDERYAEAYQKLEKTMQMLKDVQSKMGDTETMRVIGALLSNARRNLEEEGEIYGALSAADSAQLLIRREIAASLREANFTLKSVANNISFLGSMGWNVAEANKGLADAEDKLKLAWRAWNEGDYRAALSYSDEAKRLASEANKKPTPPIPPRRSRLPLFLGGILLGAALAYFLIGYLRKRMLRCSLREAFTPWVLG